MQCDAGNRRRAVSKCTIQLGDARRDGRASDRAMQLDRGGNRQDVLVGHEPARGNERGLGRRQLAALGPESEQHVHRIRVEARNRRPQLGPGVRASPEKAGAAWREQPFVRRGREEVGAEVRDVDVLIREAMHAVHDQQAAVRRSAAAIRARDRLGDPGDRRLDSRGRLHPRDADGSRLRRDRARHAIDDLLGAGGGGRVEHRDIPHRAAGARRGETNRLVMGIVIVLGGDDFLIAADPQTLIGHRERLGRIGCQRDLTRLSTDVVGERALHGLKRPAFGLRERRDFDPHGIAVELPPVVVDGVGNGLGMGDEEERRKVSPVGGEREQLSHRRPVDGAAVCQRPRHPRRRGESSHRRRQRCSGEGFQKIAARERHAAFPPFRLSTM